MRLLLFLLITSVTATAQTGVDSLLEQKTAAKIRALDESLDGVLGMAAIDLVTGRILSYNGDVVFPQASSIKIPIMIQVFRCIRAGEFGMNDALALTEKDLVGGSGGIQEKLKKGPLTLTTRELLHAMIRDSDNVATNKLIAMARMERVNRTLDELGFPATRLQRRMMDGAAAARNQENISTPLEMARLVELIYRGRAVDEAASREMLDIMKMVKASMRKGVPESVEVASKPGGIPGVRCESGVVFLPGRPFVLSVMSTFLSGEKNPVTDVTALVYAHFERLARSNRYGHRLE